MDQQSIESYHTLVDSGVLMKLHCECISGFVALGGEAAAFEVQAWWVRSCAPVGWKAGGQQEMQPRVTELFNAEYLVKMHGVMWNRETQRNVNVYKLVDKPHGLPIGWNKQPKNERILQLERRCREWAGQVDVLRAENLILTDELAKARDDIALGTKFVLDGR